eukprot:COSAG02_NODE_18107_length_960_cov_8.243902_1_plen_159_part_00
MVWVTIRAWRRVHRSPRAQYIVHPGMQTNAGRRAAARAARSPAEPPGLREPPSIGLRSRLEPVTDAKKIAVHHKLEDVGITVIDSDNRSKIEAQQSRLKVSWNGCCHWHRRRRGRHDTDNKWDYDDDDNDRGCDTVYAVILACVGQPLCDQIWANMYT